MTKHPHADHAAAGRRRVRFDVRLVLALVLLASAFGISGYSLLRDPQAHAAHVSETRVLGRSVSRELAVAGDVSVAARKLARAYLRQPIRLQVGKKTYLRTRAALGVQVDVTGFADMLRAAGEARSPLRRLHAQQNGDAPLDLPVPAHLEGDRADRWVRALADQHHEPVHPMRAALDSGLVSAARAGRALDVQGTLDALAQALFVGSGSVRAKLVERTPAPSRLQAGEHIDVTRVLGAFESRAVTLDESYRHNLLAAAQRLDGIVLDSRDELDFLALTGPPHGSSAYRVGGVSPLEGDPREAALSQVASTLYAAALFAGLPVLEQHPRARPSRDIELGFDAAITQGHNLRFRNDLRTPIAIAVSVRDGVVHASLRGAASSGREVDIVRSIEAVTPYVELTRAEPSLPLGVLSLLQRGTPGLRVLLTRSVRENEDDTSQQEQRTSVYAPCPRIVRLGSGDGNSKSGRAFAVDERAEYVVDEEVSYGMRPGLSMPQESERRAGRTGIEGWTAQDGP